MTVGAALPERTDAKAAPQYVLQCLGTFGLTRRSDQADVAPRGRKARALIAYLTLGGAATRESLAGLLWSERGEEQARASLRNTLLELRELTEAGLLKVDRERVGAAQDLITTDVGRVEAWAESGDFTAVDNCLGQWNGKLLADLDSIDPAFDDWLPGERMRRQERLFAGLVKHLSAHLDSNAARSVIGRLMQIEPENEAVLQLALRADHLAGDVSALRKHYQRFEERLLSEFNAKPTAETRRLFDELVSSTAVAAKATFAAPQPNGADPLVSNSASDPVRERVKRAAVIGAVAIMLGILGWLVSGLREPATAPAQELFVAVLPFADLSGDPKFAYFAEGIAAEIRATLARHQRGMRIAGTATSLQFKSGPRDVAAIHKAIGTTHIVDGSVRRDGARVRIIAQLTDARDGSLLWTGTYDRSLELALDIQADVARQVAAALNLAAPAMAPEGLRIPPQVLERYLHGMRILRDGIIVHAIIPEAVENLKAAVREAPDFARGWAALAMAYVELGRRQDEQQQAETMVQARAAAARAAALDPQLASAHAALARVEPEWSWSARYTHLQRAMALAPGEVEVLRQWSDFLYAIGRLSEREQVEREILSLDPLSAFSQFKLMMRAIWVHDFAAAEQRLRKRLAEDPRASYLWIRYYWGHINAGNVAQARGALAEVERHWSTIQAMNGWNTDVARNQLELLRKWQLVAERGYVPSEVRAAHEAGIESVRGPLRGQGCVLTWLEGIFDKESGRPDLGWRAVEELYIKRGFVGTVATCPLAAYYRSFGDGQAVFPERQAPTWAFWEAHWDHRDPRSWRLFATVGLARFWLETGRWPDFCTEPTLTRYDCKAEARKAIAAAK